jgi:predicted HAD superfamily Cof-like phosphohydrolase
MSKLNPDMVQDVLDFHEKFNQYVGTTPAWPPFDVMRMRFKLVDEEYTELKIATGGGSFADMADSCADLVYVIIGMCNAMGIDLRPVWTAVHRANMQKEGGGLREDGKVLKPEGWVPPDISAILEIQPPLRKPSLDLTDE